MTTRTRESSLPGKEKRGTSPSNVAAAAATQRRRSPVPSKPNSPARSDDSEKRVPNYLKPTHSSGHDVSKQGKKPASASDSPQKPSTLARRRSLDNKPPSPSRTQKTQVSPNPTPRSSSTSGKMSTSQKVGSDRSLKGPKDVGKQHTLYARPVSTVKKGVTSVKKQETGRGGSSIIKKHIASPPEKVHDLNTAEVPEPETQTEDQELVNVEQIENNNEEGAKELVLEDQEQGEGGTDSVEEDQEPVNIEEHEAESDDENEPKIVTFEPSTNSELQDAEIVAIDASPVSAHDDAILGAKTEELDEKSDVEELDEVEEQSMNEPDNINNTDENVERIEEVEEKEMKQQQQQQQQEEIEMNNNEEAYESEETEKQEVVAEQKLDAENEVQKEQVIENAVPRAQLTHGKKDAAVSNDVIEETANKLREQRKNKVKALAGAFETVISLQEPK